MMPYPTGWPGIVPPSLHSLAAGRSPSPKGIHVAPSPVLMAQAVAHLILLESGKEEVLSLQLSQVTSQVDTFS